MTATTEGTLLNGRLSYRQLRVGHRTGFEPVLLAAAVPAQAGQRVLEAGTGAGAALLCLCARVPRVSGIGLEIEPMLAALANHNFRANALPAIALPADISNPPFGPIFDHVLANPPWHDPAGTTSADRLRARAHRAPAGLLGNWIAGMTAVLKPDGTISLILPASPTTASPTTASPTPTASIAAALAALAAAGHGAVTLLPLHPRADRPPHQIILQSRRGPAATRTLPGLVLHDAAGISEAADDILRRGASLNLEVP